MECLQIKGELGKISEELLEHQGDLGNGAVTKVMHMEKGVLMARKLVHLECDEADRVEIMEQIKSELKKLRKWSSPYIVDFYGAFVDNNDISICVEFMDGLSLDLVLEKVGRLQENYIGKISLAVVNGLIYINNERIKRRDIKPSKILVNSNGKIKLCDIGLCGLFDTMAKGPVGTRSYMAANGLRGSRFTEQTDIYCLGMTLIELAVGMNPENITEADYAEIFNKPIEEIILADEYSPSLPKTIFSDELCNFVGMCIKGGPHVTIQSLAGETFYTEYADVDDNGEFAEFVKYCIYDIIHKDFYNQFSDLFKPLVEEMKLTTPTASSTTTSSKKK